MYGNTGPVLIWLNLNSREEVNALHELWSGLQARIVSPPESKLWKLHEFTAADLDGNLLRVFYDFAWETREDRRPAQPSPKPQREFPVRLPSFENL
jgi:hypothetical protein